MSEVHQALRDEQGSSRDGSVDRGEPSSAENRVTPMMAQYIEIKAANPDCLLFYRMGDFYELFFDDAEEASRALGIMLTKRGKHGGADIPMCGVPVERADDYLQRLIAAGYRVAVCEQLEDPAEAKKRGGKSVVRRDVVRLVTPGTITEENLLEPGRANILAALARVRAGENDHEYAIAAIDISTGDFRILDCDAGSLAAELARLEPSEIVLTEALRESGALSVLLKESRAAIAPVGASGTDGPSAARRLMQHFGLSTLDGLGQFSRAGLAAAALILGYIERTQFGTKVPLSPPRSEREDGLLRIDGATRANLELTRTLSGHRQGSLLDVIDATVSPPGSRLLAERLAGPLADAAQIERRLDSVAFFVEDSGFRADLRQRLKRAPDMARALTRLAMQRGGPRDLAQIRDGLGAAAFACGCTGAERPSCRRN